jgi:hypothetical protein
VPLVISTDAHITSQFDNMVYGVSSARRGWVEKKDVLNALPYDELMVRLRTMREKKSARAEGVSGLAQTPPAARKEKRKNSA